MENVRLIKTKGYTDAEVMSIARIIIPDKLPVKITTGGERTLIPVGECAIIPPYVPMIINSSVERYEIWFTEEVLRAEKVFGLIRPIVSVPFMITSKEYKPEKTEALFGFIKPIYRNEGTKPEDVRITPMSLIKGAIKNLEEGDYFAEVRGKAIICALFCLIGDRAIEYNSLEGKSEVLKKLAAAVEFIVKNCDKSLELADIAAAVDYNKNHMSHFFKEFYGIPLYDYVLRVRCRFAAKYILESDYPIEQIIKLTGFNSSSTFNRVFKAEMGYSPRDYKKLYISLIENDSKKW